MEQNEVLNYDSLLTVGVYSMRLQSSIIPEEWLASIIDTLKDLIGWGIEVMKDKNIKILSANVVEDASTKYVEIKFELLQNPVPVVAIVFAVLAVLGIFGAFLTFSSIEKIVDNPVIGTGVGLGIILLVGFLLLYFVRNFKTLFKG